MNKNAEEKADRMAAEMLAEFRKRFSDEQMAFLMDMAYDPQAHQQEKPTGPRQATQKDVEAML